MSKGNNSRIQEVLARIAETGPLWCQHSGHVPAMNVNRLNKYEAEIKALEKSGLVVRDNLKGDKGINLIAITALGTREYKRNRKRKGGSSFSFGKKKARVYMI